MNIDLKIGDIILTGKFKNKRVEVKSFGKDDHGQPTVNGKPMLSFRIEKLMEENIMKLTKSRLKEIIEAEIRCLNENKGAMLAAKEIARFRKSLFPKLNDNDMWDFGVAMYEFFKSYKS